MLKAGNKRHNYEKSICAFEVSCCRILGNVVPESVMATFAVLLI